MCLLALASHASGQVYSQAPNYPNGRIITSQYSVISGASWMAMDDFTLSHPATINGLTWQGGIDYPGQWPATMTGFHIYVFGNSIANEPDFISSPLYETYIPGTAGETYVGSEFGGTQGLNVYNYGATLPTAFHAQANTRYWLSIVTDQASPYNPYWGWASGTGGDGSSFLHGIDVENPNHRMPTDLAFTLTSAPVPEPSTMAILALGAVALARRRLRR